MWTPFFNSDKTILLDKCSLALRLYPNDPKRCLVQAGLTGVLEETAIPKYEIGNIHVPILYICNIHLILEIQSAELQVGRLKLKNPSVPRAIYNFDKIRTLRIPSPAGLQVCGPFEVFFG